MELTIKRYVNGDYITEEEVKNIVVEDSRLLEIMQGICNRVEAKHKVFYPYTNTD